MVLLYQIIPEFSNEMMFFSAISALGLFFLLLGWIMSIIVDADFEFLGDDIDVGEITDIELGEIESNPGDVADSFSGDGFSGDLPIPSFFSLKVLRIVMLSFGIGGNVGLRLGLDFFYSFILASVVGLLSGIIVYRAFAYVYKQTIYNFRDPKIVGREGRVVLNIPANGYGQIMVLVVGQRYVFRAVSHDDIDIEEGTPIVIKAKKKGTCSVVLVNEL